MLAAPLHRVSRDQASPKDLLYAVASLCLPVADEGVAYSQRMVALLINGLRYEDEDADADADAAGLPIP